jgi:hypothetical protein
MNIDRSLDIHANTSSRLAVLTPNDILAITGETTK